VINFRYHLASLIAVFLALGLGIVAGSTFVSPETVRALQHSLQSIDAKDRAVEAQNNQLNQTNNGLVTYAEASRDLLVQGRLAGRPAVLLSFDTTAPGEAGQMASTLVAGGARLQGSIVLSSKLALGDDASRGQVAAVVANGASADDAVQAALAHQLADALSGGTPGILQRLIDAGLAAQAPGVQGEEPVAPSSLAVPGSLIVVLGGAVPQAGAKPAPDLGRTVVEPVVRALSGTQAVVAVGEDGSSPLPMLSILRGDPSLKVVTVDSVDQPTGQAAVVLGLLEAATAHTWGAYGLGSGASAPLPSPLPTAPGSVTTTTGSPATPRR